MKNILNFVNQLEYFDFMAYLGRCHLHPGGFKSTLEIFNFLQLNQSCRILEVGCGTGMTSLKLLRAGYWVNSCDINPKMVETASKSYESHGFFFHKPALADAANLPFENNGYDVVLLEAVYGFIQNRNAAREEFKRVLKKKGYLCFVDMHYISKPSPSVQHDLEEIFGYRIPVFSKDDWLNNFQEGYSLLYWKDYDMISPKPFDKKKMGEYIKNEKKIKEEKIVEQLVEIINEKLNAFNDIFEANRKFLKYHIAIWQKVEE